MNGQILQSAGQGDAVILPAADMSGLTNQIHYLDARKRQKEAAVLKAKQEQDKAFAEEQKWNPGKAWYFHTDELNNKVKNVFDLQTQVQQGDNSPETLRKLRDAKWDAETTAKMSQDIQKMYPYLTNEINQGLDKYEDKALVTTRLNDEILRKGSVRDTDFNKLGNIKGFTDSDTFNDRLWAYDFAKTAPEKVESVIKNLGAGAINDKETKSKFYEIDSNGDPVVGANGVYVLKDSKEVLTAIKQEPRIVRKATELVEAGKYNDIDQAIREEYIRPYASSSVRVNQTKAYKPTKEGSGKDDEEVTLTHAYDTEENFTLGNDATGRVVRKAYSPHEIRIGGKQSEKPVFLNAENYIDPTTNKPYADQSGNNLVGDKEIITHRLRLIPYNTKTEKILVNDKANVTAAAKSPDIEMRWYLTGTMVGKDEFGIHPTKKPVVIPYDEIKEELKEKRGVDLDDREDGQYSMLEAKQIAANTNLPAKEKALLVEKLTGKKLPRKK